MSPLPEKLLGVYTCVSHISLDENVRRKLATTVVSHHEIDLGVAIEKRAMLGRGIS